MKRAVFGATGLTGGCVVVQALEDGHDVAALVRDPRRVSLSHPRLTVIAGNPVVSSDVERCVCGADAVIHCLGIGGKGDGKPNSLISDSVLVTLAAMEQHRVPRIVGMSNAGVGGSGSCSPTASSSLASYVGCGPSSKTRTEWRLASAGAPVSEGDGWLMGYVYDATTDSSKFVILDARDLSENPAARVILPQRVPFGFHGIWIADHAARTAQ